MTSNSLSRHQAELEAGDRVVYAASFLRSIGAYTGELPFRTGTVLDTRGPGRFVLVEWDDADLRDDAEPGARRGELVGRRVLWPANKKHLEPR